MPYTNCKAHMEFVDVSALSDSSPEFPNADIGKLELLKADTAYPAYLIPDLNSAVLDGSRTIMEDETRIPLISGISGDDRTFTTPPVLAISFTSPHTSAGITLFFMDDYPAEIKVTWYDTYGQKIIEEEYVPDALTFLCKKQVENYGKIVITFLKTRLPQQRVKLRYIKYGMEIEWSGQQIQTASITEELDTTSATIPVGTCDISVVDAAGEWDVTNKSGIWKSIQKSQHVSMTEEVGTSEVPCGKFYIDTWQSGSNVVSFSLIDRMGIMDKTKFYGGKIYTGETAGEVIDAIMADAGVTEYKVAEDVAAVQLYGHIPICTHREALQQVVFACGAVAGCDRQGYISIRMPDRSTTSTITTDRKFMGTTVEMADYVSGISIAYKSYSLQAEASEIYNDTLPAGTTTMELSEPYMPESITAEGGTVVAAATNYVTVSMNEAGTCVIKGRKYESQDITYTARVAVKDAGEVENIQSYEGGTLFNAERAKEVAERMLNYYQLRQIVSIRYLMQNEVAGNWVEVQNTDGSYAVTGITQQTIDLTGGYIASATCRGYSTITVADYYAGMEIYAGERGLI